MIPRALTPAEAHKVEDALLAARLLRPYYARAIAALSPLAVEDGAMNGPLAVDDAWRLYVSEKCLAEHDAAEVGLLIGAHEVEHLLRCHGARRKAIAANPFAWNLAADAEINDDEPKLPDWCVRPSSLGCEDGLTAEEYLCRAEVSGKITYVDHQGACGGGSGAGRPLDGELGHGDEQAPAITEQEAERIRDSVARDVIDHHNRKAGNVPKDLLVWANARAKPIKMDWRRMLRATLALVGNRARAGRSDYSWSRLSRRWRHGMPLRPGMIDYEPTVGLVVDTSGSMGDEGDNVLSTVASLCRSVGTVKAWAVDTEPHRIRGPLRVAKWVGGGGTDLRPALALAEKECGIVVAITDCETPWPEPMRVPLVVAAVSGHGPKWAETVKVEIDRG